MSLKERRSVLSTGGSTPRQEKMVVERSNSSANVDSSVSQEFWFVGDEMVIILIVYITSAVLH